MRPLATSALVFLTPILLGGCGTSPGPAVRDEYLVDFTPEQKAQLQQIEEQDYVIRRGDVLAVRDMFHEQIDQEAVLVLPDGSAGLFGIGQVRVAGLTLNRLGEMLTGLYAREYRDPRVTVAVRELGSNEVFVMGEVASPGSYPIPYGGFSVLGVIALAGGFGSHANSDEVVLVRITPQGYMCRKLDVQHIDRAGTVAAAITDLQPFDVVYVPRTAIGDFAAFTESVFGSLLTYGQLAANLKYVTGGETFWR
ncbi:MAG: polysaccharide biosynthesis/export family protein [Candidatus Krumholzibacteriia bacterium]